MSCRKGEALLLVALAFLFLLPRPPWGSPHYGEILLLLDLARRGRHLRSAWNDLPVGSHVLLLSLSLSTAFALLAGRVPMREALEVLLRTAEVLLLLAVVRCEGRDLRPLLLPLALAASLLGLGEVLATPPPLFVRAFETWSYGESNHFAALLALASVSLARSRPLVLPLLLLALLYTGSRTAFLACLVGLAVAFGRILPVLLLVAGAILLHPPMLFDREIFPEGILASPHAPRLETWRILLPAAPLEALLGRGAAFAPHRFYEAEWVRLWVEGGAVALLAAGALFLSLLREGRNRAILFTLLFLGLGMNVFLIGRVALVGTLLLGSSDRAEEERGIPP